MFKYCSLYSGSSGNSFFVQTPNTNLIIDAGVSVKKITTALQEINVDAKDIDAILVTHDHIDHTKSLATLSNKYNIPIYANKKTWNAIPNVANKVSDNKFYANTENGNGENKIEEQKIEGIKIITVENGEIKFK